MADIPTVTEANLESRILLALQLVSGDISSATLLIYINDAKRDIQDEFPTWYQDKNRTLTLTGGQDGSGATSYALPSDWWCDNFVYIIDGSALQPVLRMNREAEIRVFPRITGETQGRPTHYDIWSNGFMIFKPTPDKAYTVNQDYISILAEFSAGGESDNLSNNAARLVVCRVCTMICEDNGWNDDAVAWLNRYELQKRRVLRRQTAGRIRNMPMGMRPPHVLR